MTMSLLKEIQRLTENTYSFSSEINLEHFLIGRKRFSQLSELTNDSSRKLSDVARVFFRFNEGDLLLAIYYSDQLIQILERFDPRRGVNENNITAFIIFLEEVSHAVHISLRFREGLLTLGNESLIRDLELQAKVDTYLTLKFFLSFFNPSKKLEPFDKIWLRVHLFSQDEACFDDPLLKERYQEVNRFGEKIVRFFDCLSPEERLGEMRRFRLLNYYQKSRLISLLP